MYRYTSLLSLPPFPLLCRLTLLTSERDTLVRIVNQCNTSVDEYSQATKVATPLLFHAQTHPEGGREGGREHVLHKYAKNKFGTTRVNPCKKRLHTQLNLHDVATYVHIYISPSLPPSLSSFMQTHAAHFRERYSSVKKNLTEVTVLEILVTVMLRYFRVTRKLLESYLTVT